MKNYYYSPKTNSFYPHEMKQDYIDAGSLPDDLVEVEDSVFQEYIATPPENKIRGNVNGMPGWVDLPAPTKEELIREAEGQKALRMREATVAIAPLQDAVDLGMATDEEAALLNKWKSYRVMLNRVDTSNPAKINWPSKPE